MVKLRILSGLFIACAAVLSMACGDNKGDLSTRQECNPLGGTNCITPWPSSIYEASDPSSPTRVRLAVPEGALPTNTDGVPISPTLINGRDGFSAAAPMITAFETGVDPANLVTYVDMGKSVTADSPTVIINMATGELVEHFAELDARVPEQPDKQALYIRPAQMLDGGTRYAVAIKKTLKAKDGSELPIPEGFQAIVDGTDTNHEALERIRPGFAEIFAKLETHGIAPTDLVTAWDFTTATRESMRAEVLAARDVAMPAMGDSGSNITFQVTDEEPHSSPGIEKRIDGEYDSPLFLTHEGRFTPATVMARDGVGGPELQGMYRSPFTALIPACALDGRGPVPVMIYGHGLLGDSDQAASSGPRHVAEQLCMISIGTDMRGMSENDVGNVALSLNDLNKGATLFEGLVQGVVNHIALVEAVRGPMASTLFVNDEGKSIVDPDRIYYYGISQGGIFGGTHCGFSPHIQKCVLQVGAINYSMMLERSLDWPVHRTVLIGAYPDPLDVALNIHLMQMFWDYTDPVVIADAIVGGNQLAGLPPKQVLMEVAIADVEVPNIASEYQARTMGIPILGPTPSQPHGIEVKEGPLDSALVYYEFGFADTIPLTNEPPPDNDVHGDVRVQTAHIEMMRRFFEDGEIVQTCSGDVGCDCTTGACGDRL